jgi:hypothetical protein
MLTVGSNPTPSARTSRNFLKNKAYSRLRVTGSRFGPYNWPRRIAWTKYLAREIRAVPVSFGMDPGQHEFATGCLAPNAAIETKS